MLLAVDCGNTTTAFGLVGHLSGGMIETWRVSSAQGRTSDEWSALVEPFLARVEINASAIEGMIVSSVVPSISAALADFGKRHLGVEPMMVSHELDLGVSLRVDKPDEVGADRLVNSAYGYELYGGPLIVVDLGTATKIEAITRDGDYLGGVIAPGIGLSIDSLASRAARLYAVRLEPPNRAVGRNTVEAMQSGVVLGHLAMIEGMVARVSAEIGTPRHVVLTGGYSAIVAEASDVFTNHVPDLTLRGLQFLYARNASRRQ